MKHTTTDHPLIKALSLCIDKHAELHSHLKRTDLPEEVRLHICSGLQDLETSIDTVADTVANVECESEADVVGVIVYLGFAYAHAHAVIGKALRA